MPGPVSGPFRSRLALRAVLRGLVALAVFAVLFAPREARAADDGGLHVVVETRSDLRDPRLPARPVAALRWSALALHGPRAAPAQPWLDRARFGIAGAAGAPRLLDLPDETRGARDYGVEFGSLNLSQTDNTRLSLRVRRGQPMLYWRVKF